MNLKIFLKGICFVATAAAIFSACNEEVIEPSAGDDAPVLTIGFEDADTRIQLDEELKTIWTKNDCISVFYLSDANQKWQFQGETGSRIGYFKSIDSGTATEDMGKIVVVYPYDGDYSINTETYELKASLPAVQTYMKDSYGLDGNMMVSQSENNQLALKSVCGWLKLQLTGSGEKVNSINVRGNDGEQVAGVLYIDSDDASSVLASDRTDISDEEVGTEVTLVCPDGVTLGSEPADFFIALPPQTFSKGLLVEVNCSNDIQYCKYTQKSITIERNTIQPLKAINTEDDMDLMDPELPPYDEIWYTSTTGAVVPLMSSAGFGAKVVSNTYEDGKGIIKFDGVVTAIGARAYNNDYSPNQTLETVTIPTSVTSIGELAFRYCRSLRDINLHDDITHIGERAFIYTNLSEVTIPKGLTELSKQVFDSTPLKSIVIPDNIKIIRERAFCFCSELETIVIGDGVTDIELCAFEIWSPSTVSVTLGKNVTTMGNNVFDGCTGTLIVTGNIPFTNSNSSGNGWIYGADFSEIVLGDDVETVPDQAFYSSSISTLKKITIGKGVKSIGKNIVYDALSEVNVKDLAAYCQIDFNGTILKDAKLYVNDQRITELVIPDGVNEIPAYAFSGCSGLQFVSIPESVTSIASSAFAECASLISVNQAENVQTIASRAFYNCSQLCYMPVTSNLTNIGDYAFYNNSKLSLSASPVNVKTLGKYAFYQCKSLGYSLNLRSATSIGEWAFYGCTGIARLDISSATTIGTRAFYGCSQMVEVLLSGNLTKIQDSVFSYTALRSITLPNSLQYIGDSAFASSKLESLTIPESVTYIDCYAFEYNRNLVTVYCMPVTPPDVGTDYDDGARYWDAFDGCDAKLSIYVPRTSLDTYKSTSYWGSYKNKMVGYDF